MSVVVVVELKLMLSRSEAIEFGDDNGGGGGSIDLGDSVE